MRIAIVAKRDVALELYQGLIDFLINRDHEVIILDPNELYLDLTENSVNSCENNSPVLCDLLLNRSVASDAYFVKDIIRALKSAGTLIYNDRESTLDYANKILTHEYLTSRLVPNLTTKVTLFKNLASTLDTFPKDTVEFVIKENFGHGGRGVYKTTRDEYLSLPFSPQDYVIVQKYAHQKFDYRVLVLDGVVLGIMKRTPPEGEFRSNMGLGSRSEIVFDDNIAKLALLAAHGLDFAGVDILEEEGDLKVIEINSKPSYKYFEVEHNIEVASLLGNSLLNFYKNNK